jgi:hypothetical protein
MWGSLGGSGRRFVFILTMVSHIGMYVSTRRGLKTKKKSWIVKKGKARLGSKTFSMPEDHKKESEKPWGHDYVDLGPEKKVVLKSQTRLDVHNDI